MKHPLFQSRHAFALPEQVPVFPLPGVLLLPGTDLPLYIFEPRYRRMLRDCLETDKFLAVTLLKAGWEKKTEPLPIHGVVGVGYVRAVFENPDGTSHILLRGMTRARIVRHVQWEPYRVARIREFPDEPEDEKELLRLSNRLRTLLSRKIRYGSERPQDPILIPREFDQPSMLSHLATFFAAASPALKQDLLESPLCSSRLRHLIGLLEEELHPASGRN